MVVTKEQFIKGVVNFIDCEIGRKVTGLKKFEVYFMLPSVNKMLLEKLNIFSAKPELAEFFDEAGNIQLDTVVNSAKEAMQKTLRVEVPLLAVTLEESDIITLESYIQRA